MTNFLNPSQQFINKETLLLSMLMKNIDLVSLHHEPFYYLLLIARLIHTCRNALVLIKFFVWYFLLYFLSTFLIYTFAFSMDEVDSYEALAAFEFLRNNSR